MICRGLQGGEPCSFTEALLQGLDRRGGLLLPTDWPVLPRRELEDLLALDFVERSARLTRRLLGDEFGGEACDRIAREAFDFPVPLRSLGGRVHILELFHGPTLAFKDLGARFLAHAMAEARAERSGGRERITILTATSGDTGAAVAQAFFGVEGIEVVVLYPAGRISPVQEMQIATPGGNVHALSVGGTFDDCQRLVRAAFQDPELRKGAGLTTANSMNLGRLIPQTFYYFEAVAALARVRPGREVRVSVPSGNFGNLAAGILAWRMGLPVRRFVAATNANDTVPRYLAGGVYEPRPTIPTHATAMDVGAPGNWARIESLLQGDIEEVRARIRAVGIGDGEILETIRRVERASGYVLDPHSAVGHAALEKTSTDGDDCEGVVFGTAHPAKFNEVIRLALGREVPWPASLERCLRLPRRDLRLEPTPEALRAFLWTLLA